MAWIWVQGGKNWTVTNQLQVPLANPTPAGNLLVCVLSQFNQAVGVSVVATTLNQQFTRAVGLAANPGVSINCELWYWVAVATATYTINATNVSFVSMFVDEYAPPPGTISVAGTSTGSGNSTSPAPSAYANGAGNLSLGGFCFGNGEGTITQGAQYTITEQFGSVPSNRLGGAAEYRIPAIASDAPALTLQNATNWIALGASFAPAGGTAGPSSILLSDGIVPGPLRRHSLYRHIIIPRGIYE